jgi:hypothetical protein|tara:strand:+ start:1798 stop:2331 length:534 start_codon:yes stop_codon:yes gene_type:complete
MKNPKPDKPKAVTPPALPSMREVSGPFDPFKEKRERYVTSDDPMMQVCGWIARAWREPDAVEICGVDHTEWLAWKIDNPEEFRASIVLGQSLIFAEIRGVALGITTRRGQAASQKLLLEMLGAKKPPSGKKSEADKAKGNLSVGQQAEAMGQFGEDELKRMAGFEDDDPDDLEGRAG